MQRAVPARDGEPTPPRPCPRCGGPLRASHHEYAGRGTSATVLRCAACGHSVRGQPRPDADRESRSTRRSRRHQPIDEGPPTNPVIDAELAQRLLDELGG